jgi:toxin YoeB
VKIKQMPKFERQYRKWLKVNGKICGRIDELIQAATLCPFVGVGKPKKLLEGKDVYSRRIDRRHRLIYAVRDDIIYLVSCYGHYDDH